MIFGKRAQASDLVDAHFIILLGQSNADGRREPTRLQNTQYNYKGIGAGYPSVRSGQDQYVANPSNVYIYRKAGIYTDDFSPDNGAWQAYVAGSNSSYDDNAFGTELACATRLADTTGKPVYIIKVAFGGTGLSDSCDTSTIPGNWNHTIRYMAAEFWIKRALRDFRSANPTLRPRLLGINWWQGEQDTVDDIPTATYEAQFALFRAYMQRIIEGNFVSQDYIWNITKLKFNENAAEALINTALANIAAAHSDTFLVDSTPYPQGDALTLGESSPLATGSPNADGGTDNAHSSYIGLLGVGEYMADNMIAHHGL